MSTEYYAPKARAEAEEVEAVVWELVKDRYSDSTVTWANINAHPNTGKFGVVLPGDWRELGVDIAEVDISTHDDMVNNGWFPVPDIS